MAAATPTESHAFKLVTGSELAELQASGAWSSALDKKDGYIHMCVAADVKETARLYYASVADLSILKVDLASLPADRLKWDYVGSRKTAFPHLYGMDLPMSAVVEVIACPLGEDGVLVFPVGLP